MNRISCHPDTSAHPHASVHWNRYSLSSHSIHHNPHHFPCRTLLAGCLSYGDTYSRVWIHFGCRTPSDIGH